MAGYTIAASVRAALTQATELWPLRSKASDGTIGDARHRAEKSSDHNPDINGIVHAFDLTHDPAHGCDCNVLAEQLRLRVLAGLERRVKYVIWNRRIFNKSVDPSWRPYAGSDPHTNHIHVSILSGSGPENDTSPWWASTPAPAPAASFSRGPDMAHVVDALDDPAGGAWVLQDDGGIFTYHGANYYGSYPGLNIDAGNKRKFGTIQPRQDGGYDLVATTGEVYQFPRT